MRIQILGTGCPKCKQLAEQTEQAVRELGLDAEIEKITQIVDIVKFGVMTTPALAVDRVVKSTGKVLSAEQIKQYLA